MINETTDYEKTGESFEKSFLSVNPDPTRMPPQVLSTFAAKPFVITQMAEDFSEAIVGSRLLGLNLFVQGEQIARVLNFGERTVVIEMARRSTKTTAIFATLIGRMINRPNYKIVFTAQDGTRARQKFREILLALQAKDFEGISDPNNRLGELYFGAGTERIELDNGSKMWVVAPDPGNFRGEAADVIFIDEAGELAPDKADALLAGALPLMDTRPQGQVIIAGTPNTAHRAGLLWQGIQDLVQGVAGVGGVIYAAADDEVFADLSDPDNPVYDVELLKRVHPGIACGLTTVEIVMSRINAMGLEKWSAEYLCQWPLSPTASALDIEAWNNAGTDFIERPERVGIAWDVEPDGSSAALVAAWRIDGKAYVEVLVCQGGSDWLPAKVKQAYTKYPRAIGYDSIGQNIDIANKLERPPYRVRQTPLTMKAMIGAAARFDKEIRSNNLSHFDQPVLNDAVSSTTWRPAGKDGRLFSRKLASKSVAPAVAASEALWIYDQMSQKAPAKARFMVA